MERRIPTEDALPGLIQQLMDDDEDVRYRAAARLTDFGQPILGRAIQWAQDPRPRMREMACYVLGQTGFTDPARSLCRIHYLDGVPTLLELLEHDLEPEVRAGAAAALGHIQAPATIPALLRHVDEPSRDVRFDVTFALGSMPGGEWDDPHAAPYRSAVQAALLRLMDDPDEHVRDWATFGLHLGDHDTPEVRTRFWTALEDPNPDVRGEAVRGLAEFNDRSLIPRLERLLREDDALPVLYFEAAEQFADPTLLPAVRSAAELWRGDLKEGEKMPYQITSAIEALEKAAAAAPPSPTT